MKWLPVVFALTGCTLSAPFGTQCVSDQNCGCAGCCSGYRCLALGPGVDPDAGGGHDAGVVWRVTTFVDVDAGLSAPTALAIDAAGRLYVADTNNNCVRAVEPSGAVSTVACGLNGPQGLALSGRGDLYIADTSNNCIRERSANGDGGLFVLSGRCSPNGQYCQDWPDLQFGFPSGLAFSQELLYVADLLNNQVRWVRSDGLGGTLAGKGSSSMPRLDGTCAFASSCGSSSSATFDGPFALAMADASTLFIADTRNCALRKMTTAPGCSVTTVGPRGCPMLKSEWNMSQLLYPSGVVVARDWATSGIVYVTDDGNQRVAAVDAAGALTNLAGNGAKGFSDGVGVQAQFNDPAGIVVDSSGRLYVADTGNNRIRLLTPELR